jgi:Ca2+-binding EF-hand superfamily protein
VHTKFDIYVLLYRYDTGKDKFIDFQELKLMMEKLEAPQTHISLKAMIKEIDEGLK